ncbi:MAG: phage head closure protein [Planctomycetota bacterium]
MTPGQLRDTITIERPAKLGADDAGQPREGWEAAYEGVPACVQFVSGIEPRRGEQVEAASTMKVTIRPLPDITPKMRVRFGERILEIEGVGDPTGRRHWLVMRCVETK